MQIIRHAHFDPTVTEYPDGISMMNGSVSALIEIEGVEFKSWLPKSKRDAAEINAAAQKIVGKQPTPIMEFQ